MEIYIELYVLNNFILNYILNYLSVKFSSLNLSQKRIIVSTIISVIFSVIYIFIKENGIWLKIVAFFVIILSLVKITHVQDLIKIGIAFLSLSVLIAGITIFITNTINSDIYSVQFSIRLIVVYMVFISFLIIQKMVKKNIVKFKNSLIFYKNLKLSHGDKSIVVNGYYDSGNTLYDGSDYVCVISGEVAEYLNLNIVKEIIVSTVNDNLNLAIVDLEKLIILEEKKTLNHVKCAISNNLDNYKFILHRDSR